MDDKDVTEVEPKTGVDLNRVDELVLRQIVNKVVCIQFPITTVFPQFSSRSGLNFYRSCRGAMGFVDYAKPAWHRPDQRYHIVGLLTLSILTIGNRGVRCKGIGKHWVWVPLNV
jgi:hypothetical protein